MKIILDIKNDLSILILGLHLFKIYPMKHSFNLFVTKKICLHYYAPNSCLELELPLLIHKGRGPATFKNSEIGGSLKKNIDTHCLFDGIVYTNVLDK